jgi:hypothetical protein
LALDVRASSILLQYEKDKISEKIRRELKRVISDPAFTPDQVRQQRRLFTPLGQADPHTHAAAVVTRFTPDRL